MPVTSYPELEAQLDALRREWGTHALISVLAELARTDAMQAAIDTKPGRAATWTAAAKTLDVVADILHNLPNA